MKYLITIAILLLNFNSWSQGNEVIKKAETIYFYGYDFSNFKLVNPKKANDVLIQYANGLSGYLVKKLPPIDFGANMNKKIIYNFDESNRINRSIPAYNFGSFHMPEPLSKDTCIVMIQKYNLQEEKGVGLIIFMEYADKYSESTRIRPVYFDIKSRDIIYSQPLIAENAKGAGFTRHWGKSFLKSMIILSEKGGNLKSGWFEEIYKDPCGKKPIPPASFGSNMQQKNSTAYKTYLTKLRNWQECSSTNY